MMKKTLLLLAFAAFALGTHASAQILINEVYPGGGSGAVGTAYTRDYVEIYNTSATAFSLAGFTLQYAPASASNNFSGTIVAFGAGSIIGPNDYISVYTGAPGAAGSALTAGSGAGFVTYVAPTNSASLSATAGAIRLFNTTTATTMDLVGYGTVTPGPNGDPKSTGPSATAPTSNAFSIGRTAFANTGSNNADFSSMTPSPNGGMASTVVAVPEPSAWAAMAAAAGLLALAVRRRSRLA